VGNTLLSGDRRITVTIHAMDQYGQRLNDTRHRCDIEIEIIGHVRCAEKAGNILNHKPDGFRLYGEKRRQLPSGQRFVYCNADPRVGFIVKRLPQETVVVTTLKRVGVSR
jgi:hypothetical protein